MEPVTIELNEAPLFMIPGKVHLTLENPGPIEVDPTILNAQEKTWINNAHNTRKVKVVNPNSSPIETDKNVQAPKTPVEDQKSIVFPDKQAQVEKVKKLLKTPVPALKKILEESNDILLLRIAKAEEEQRKKPRKSITAILNKKIGSINATVAKNIGGEDVGGKLNPVRVAPANSEFVSEVTEESERQIVIRPATEDDFSDDLVVTDE